MEIRVLRYFLTVVREESITRAAEVLHITQPTLSRQIAQMEEEMGVRLFDRGSRKIALTSEGMLLRRRAEVGLLFLFVFSSPAFRVPSAGPSSRPAACHLLFDSFQV